jgi:hypothetical protein
MGPIHWIHGWELAYGIYPGGTRTKIPEPPIQFSGATNFFGPKNEFTSHQFETSVLDPPMSFSPLSNHQTVVKPRASRLNFYEGPIPVSEFVNCAERGKLGEREREREREKRERET